VAVLALVSSGKVQSTYGHSRDRGRSPTVPEYRTYFNPILKALKALGGSATIDELNARVAADMKLGDDALAVPHDPEHGGRSEFVYCMAWARTYLKYAGYITNSERGVWSLTPEGTKVDRIDEKKTAKEVVAKRRGLRPRVRPEPHDAEPDDEAADDGEERSDRKHELRETMHRMPPDAFERLAQRILRERGFVEVKVTGRSGDKGIDGIGLLKLGVHRSDREHYRP
jgi:restriction system protein